MSDKTTTSSIVASCSDAVKSLPPNVSRDENENTPSAFITLTSIACNALKSAATMIAPLIIADPKGDIDNNATQNSSAPNSEKRQNVDIDQLRSTWRVISDRVQVLEDRLSRLNYSLQFLTGNDRVVMEAMMMDLFKELKPLREQKLQNDNLEHRLSSLEAAKRKMEFMRLSSSISETIVSDVAAMTLAMEEHRKKFGSLDDTQYKFMRLQEELELAQDLLGDDGNDYSSEIYSHELHAYINDIAARPIAITPSPSLAAEEPLGAQAVVHAFKGT